MVGTLYMLLRPLMGAEQRSSYGGQLCAWLAGGRACTVLVGRHKAFVLRVRQALSRCRAWLWQPHAMPSYDVNRWRQFNAERHGLVSSFLLALLTPCGSCVFGGTSFLGQWPDAVSLVDRSVTSWLIARHHVRDPCGTWPVECSPDFSSCRKVCYCSTKYLV